MSKGSPRVIMAFDFGTKNIGIAIGQEITKTASTFYSINANDGQPDWVELDMIVKEWNPNLFIVGDPLNMDGTTSQSSQSAKDLAINLSKDITENIILWDERLSSQAAFNLSSDLRSNTNQKVKKLDENSAQFILQGVLDYFSKKNT